MTRTGRRPTGLLILAALAAVSVFALAGGAAAESSDVGQPMAQNLVEIKVADRAAVEQLMADAESVGAEFNDHYLRQNEDDGTVTVQVLGDDDQIAALHAHGLRAPRHDRGRGRLLGPDRRAPPAIEAERKADRYAETGISPDFNRFGLRAGVAATVTEEITINRVDYFQNYAGRFLSVEAFNATTVQQTGGGQTAGSGPTLAVTWDAGPGTEIGSGGPRNMSPYVDPDPAQDTYLYHRMLIRLGAPNTDTPPRPSRIRIASSTGAIAEADVNTWIGQSLPPHAARLPARVPQPLHGSDRDLPAVRAARGGVRRARRDRRADQHAVQDERLPAQGAGHDGSAGRPHGRRSTLARRPARTRSRRRRTGPPRRLPALLGPTRS